MHNFDSPFSRTVKQFADSLSNLGVKMFKKLRATSKGMSDKVLTRLGFAVIVWARDEGGDICVSYRSTTERETGWREFLASLRYTQHAERSRKDSEVPEIEKGPLGLPMHES